MAFIDVEKTIVITKKDGKTTTLLKITDIGPAEGFEGFVCFWKDCEEFPYFVISRDNISSMTLETFKDTDDNS